MRLRRLAAIGLGATALLGAVVSPTWGRDRPFGATRMVVRPDFGPIGGGGSDTGSTGQFSKEQIERYRCRVTAGSGYGTPAAAMDISCNDHDPYRQDFNPDNELAVAVNPYFSNHVVAGSNDYFYRFNNSTGARQAIVPTGFFTTFDGGATWIDGQVPMRSGNGAGDPAPAFSRKLSAPTDAGRAWVMMAQLENTGGQGGFYVAQGDISVSWSRDGGRTWSAPVTVMKGTGTGIGPANNATFFDKEWLTVDNHPGSPYYGRAYLTATLFVNGRHGSYARSPIVLSHSDDGGRTWTAPREISGRHPSCTHQETGGTGECDEDQFSVPEVQPDGSVYVHFLNSQRAATWETGTEFDSTIMIVKSTDGGITFGAPRPVVDLEDGFADTPYSVIGRQTVTGHQIRWTSAGTVAGDPTDADHLAIVFADNFAGTRDAAPASCLDAAPTAPDYNPCGAVTDTDVYISETFDGGQTWSPRTPLYTGPAGTDQWFPWADFGPDGSLAVAFDSNEGRDGDADRDDTFNHVLVRRAVDGSVTSEVLVPDGAGRRRAEHVDISVTHWSGQYVPESAWPRICGPDGYGDPPVADARGKDCNQFHGDYTGLAVAPSDGSVHVVWTGLNRWATSPQIDPYTGGRHDGYAQDAMYARR